MVYFTARRKYSLKKWLFVRGAAARFYLSALRVFCFSFVLLLFLFLVFLVVASRSICAVFVFSSLCLALSFLSFVRCYFLSFAFLSCPLVSFFALLYSCILVSTIYNNIINKNIYYIVCVCVCAHARARARQRRVKCKAQKKEYLKGTPITLLKNICSKCRIRCGLSSIRSRRRHYTRGGALPHQFRRR